MVKAEVLREVEEASVRVMVYCPKSLAHWFTTESQRDGRLGLRSALIVQAMEEFAERHGRKT